MRYSSSWIAGALFIGGILFVHQLTRYGISVEWHINEGDAFEPVKHIATIRGAVRFLLLGERVALNVLSRWE